MRSFPALALLAVAGLAAGCGGVRAEETQRATVLPIKTAHGAALPAQGLLVDRGHDTLLIGLDGRQYARLAGFRLWWRSDETERNYPFKELGDTVPDRTVLLGPQGRWYLLDAGAGVLRPLTEPRLPLADGTELIGHLSAPNAEEPGTHTFLVSVERGGRKLVPTSSETHVISGGLIATRSLVLDPGTGERWAVARGCVPAGVVGGQLFTVCGPPVGKEPISLVAFSRTGARRTLARFPRSLYVDSASLSPDGRYVVAALAPGCGPPYSFVVPTSGGVTRAVTGERHWSFSAPPSRALGWTADNRIVALIEHTPGCDSPQKTGVYVIDPRTLARRFVYGRAWAMWNPDPR